MRNALLFILLISSWNCSGGYRTQKDQLRPGETYPKEIPDYLFPIQEDKAEKNKPAVPIEKDSFFIRYSRYRFLSNKKIELERSFSKKTGGCIYPPYYGGSYVNRGDDRLSIYVVDSLNTRAARRDLIKRIGPEYFHICSCSYSFVMLSDTLQALETLFNKKKKTLPQSLRMSRFEIYEPKNTIVVLLEDSTADAVSTFKKYVMDSPMIQFAQQPIIYLH